MYKLVTQYRSIFSEDRERSQEIPDTQILFSLVTRKISSYLQTLSEQLSFVDSGDSIATILNDSMYFGMVMGQVGFDFRVLLCSIFESAVFSFISKKMRSIYTNFSNIVTPEYNWKKAPKAISLTSDSSLFPYFLFFLVTSLILFSLKI